MKYVSGTLGLAVTIIAVAFALTNRQTATIGLWPFAATIDAPLYLLTLGTLLLGVLVGASMTWFGAIPHRRRARRLQKELVAVQTQIAHLQHRTTSGLGQDIEDDMLLAPPKKRFWSAQP